MSSSYKNPGEFLFNQSSSSGADFSQTYNPSKPIATNARETGSDTVKAPNSLYLYSLGMKELEANYIQYGERQSFVSKPIPVIGNVMQIELDATEEHPVFDTVSGKTTERQTSVEYAISYKNKPAAADWHPILPRTAKKVQNERLFFINNKASLRFPARMESITVFVNGVRLNKKETILLSNQELTVHAYDINNLYTVDYEPDSYVKDPWVFQLSEFDYDVTTLTESFPAGTAFNKTIELSHYPYIDLEKILTEENYNPNTSSYKPIQVRLMDASIQGKGQTVLKVIEPYREALLTEAYTYNKTLYKDKSWSKLVEYNLDSQAYYGGFDYYQWQNKLVFTEHFNASKSRENLPYSHGTGTVEVTYQTIQTNFRLKITLRRNAREEATATPKVSDFQLRFKTIQ